MSILVTIISDLFTLLSDKNNRHQFRQVPNSTKIINLRKSKERFKSPKSPQPNPQKPKPSRTCPQILTGGQRFARPSRTPPLWAKIMGGLSGAITVLFLVSCCCKGLAKIIKDNNPGKCFGCVDCLEGTARIANVCALAFKAFRNSLAAVVNGNGELPRQQHETRDTDRLLPGGPLVGVPGGPLNSRQDGQVLLAESQM